MSSARINTATIWRTLAEHDTNILEEYRALYCVTDGIVVIDDEQNNTETFPVTTGQILPVQPRRLKTATTATVIGLN